LTPRANPTEEASANTGIQERVAGSREEVRGRSLATSDGPGVVTTNGETVTHSRVAGSRQSRRVSVRRAAR